MESYQVYCNDVTVGHVMLENAGLYYRVMCQCNPSEQSLYKLIAVCGSERVNIGICVPSGGGIGLDKKVPRKKFDLHKTRFCLVSHSEKNTGNFIPLFPDKPFDWLEQLEASHFLIRDGIKGLLMDP